MSNDVHIYKAIKVGEIESERDSMSNNNSRISNKIPYLKSVMIVADPALNKR